MGGRLAATTRANTRTSTDAAPARNNAREQASTVAPEVSTSSTSRSFRPATMGRHAKGALDVVGALGLVEPDLLGRRLDAFERPVRDHPAARLGDDLGQQCRLVEPTRPLSAPVQRY